MKSILTSFLSIFLTIVFFSCTNDINDIESFDDTGDTYSRAEVFNKVQGSKKNVSRWGDVKDDKLLYSVGVLTDSMFSIGVKIEGYDNLVGLYSETDFHSAEWLSARDAIVKILDKNPNNVILQDMDKLPILIAKIADLETVIELRKNKFVRHFSPMNDYFFNPSNRPIPGTSHDKGPGGGGVPNAPSDEFDNVGCRCDQPEFVYPEDKFEITFPFNNIVPWNYYLHRITPDKWDVSDGTGIGVAVIDTGVSDDQENLGSEF